MKTMRNIILLSVFVLSTVWVKGQILQPDSLKTGNNKPHIEIKVHKKYDKNGHLVQYDSTYVWTYHNGHRNVHIDMRQMMGDFRPFFRQNLPDSLLRVFGHPGFDLNDTSMMGDFFNNPHFFDDWQKELFDMNREMRAMDSLRMEFLKRYMKNLEHHGQRKNPLKAGIY